MMNLLSFIQDPFSALGTGILFIHGVQYYTLLTRVSMNLKKKSQEDFTILKSRIKAKKMSPDDILKVHRDLHSIEAKYDDLLSKINTNFNAGIWLGIFPFLAALRVIIPTIVTQELISLLILAMIIAGAVFGITFYQLLKWNLNHGQTV